VLFVLPTGAGQTTRDEIKQPTGAKAIKNESNIEGGRKEGRK